MQIALDENSNDLILKEGGGILRADKGRYTIQLVRSKIQTILGEWVLNPELGWLSMDDFVRNPDLFSMEMRIRKLILETKGVQKIEQLSLEMEGRQMIVSFTATTIYGEISLVVPWSTYGRT